LPRTKGPGVGLACSPGRPGFYTQPNRLISVVEAPLALALSEAKGRFSPSPPQGERVGVRGLPCGSKR